MFKRKKTWKLGVSVTQIEKVKKPNNFYNYLGENCKGNAVLS